MFQFSMMPGADPQQVIASLEENYRMARDEVGWAIDEQQREAARSRAQFFQQAIAEAKRQRTTGPTTENVYFAPGNGPSVDQIIRWTEGGPAPPGAQSMPSFGLPPLPALPSLPKTGLESILRDMLK